MRARAENLPGPPDPDSVQCYPDSHGVLELRLYLCALILARLRVFVMVVPARVPASL